MTPTAGKQVGPPPIAFDQRLLRYYDRLLEFTCNRASQSDAAVQVMVASGSLWRLASLARWVPRRWRDGLYRMVATDRYRWFGKRTSCYLEP